MTSPQLHSQPFGGFRRFILFTHISYIIYTHDIYIYTHDIYIYTWYIYISCVYIIYTYISCVYIYNIYIYIHCILYIHYIVYYIYIHIIVFRKSCSRSLRFLCVSPLDMFSLTMDWSDQKMERSKQDRVTTNWAVANQRWLVFVYLWHVSLEPCSFRRHVQWLSCPTVKWWLCCVVPSLARSKRSEDWNLSQLF